MLDLEKRQNLQWKQKQQSKKGSDNQKWKQHPF